MLTCLFSCCLPGRRTVLQDPHDPPDEHSHLIPATNEEEIPVPMAGSTYTVDRLQLNERMSNVIRAKESKMVTVGSRTPFNLSNKKKMSLRTDPSSSSNSRSISSSNRPSVANLSPLTNINPSQLRAQASTALRTSSTNTMESSTPISRSSSQLSSREVSMHESSQSHSSRSTPRPIFNARLVRGAPLREVTAAAAAARRGRATRRKAALELDGPGEEKGEGYAAPGAAADVQAATTFHSEEQQRPSAISSKFELGEEEEGNGTPKTYTRRTAISIVQPRPSLSTSPASSIGLKLQDTGSMTIGWGD